MLELLLPAASSYAGKIDFLFDTINLVVGFWFIVTQIAFFYLLARFAKRREEQKSIYMTGEGHEKHWIHIPHWLIIVCDVVLIWGAITVWNHVKINRPDQIDSTIRIVSQQWAWTFIHPGPDNILDTKDDIITVDELHVELDKTYVYQLESKDVLHDFSVPVFRLKQDAVPGRTISGWFKPTKTGEYDIQCAEMCGIAHGIMNARLHIEDSETHQRWMKNNASVASTANPTSSNLALNQ